MTVYVAVSDESSDGPQEGLLFVAGYSAPLEIWRDVFEPAWRERVLDPTPAIPYLHMTEILSPLWQKKHGLSWHQAESRIDAAVQVIRSTGALIPVSLSVDQTAHRKSLDLIVTLRQKQFARVPLKPEQTCFGIFALMQLLYVASREPTVERVDFCVEANGPTSANMRHYHESLPASLEKIGNSDLVPLVGRFDVVPKSDVRAQAADLLAWHKRRSLSIGSDRSSERRFSRLVNRFGYDGHVSELVLRNIRASVDATYSVEPGTPAEAQRA